MSQKKHRQRSYEEWMQIISECRNSGLSDTAWCHQNGLAPSTFYTAVKRYRNAVCQMPASTAGTCPEVHEVVPVSFDESVVAASSSPAPLEIPICATIQIVVNDYKVQMTNGCDRELIKNTLITLREIC